MQFIESAPSFKVHIFWEGHKILQNFLCRFDHYYIGQIYSGKWTLYIISVPVLTPKILDKIWKFCTEWACIHRWNNDLNICATHIPVFHTKVHFGWDCFRWQNKLTLKSQVHCIAMEAPMLSFFIDTSNTLRRTYATITNMGQLLVPTRTPVPCRPSSVSATR